MKTRIDHPEEWKKRRREKERGRTFNDKDPDAVRQGPLGGRQRFADKELNFNYVTPSLATDNASIVSRIMRALFRKDGWSGGPWP